MNLRKQKLVNFISAAFPTVSGVLSFTVLDHAHAPVLMNLPISCGVGYLVALAMNKFHSRVPPDLLSEVKDMAVGDRPLKPLTCDSLPSDIDELVTAFNQFIYNRNALDSKVENEWSLLADALNSLSSGVVVLDRHGIIISVNLSWLRLKDIWPDATLFTLGIGDNYLEHAPLDLAQIIHASLEQRNDVFEHESNCGSRKGFFSLRVHPAYGIADNEQEAKCVVSHFDITDKHQISERLSLMAAVFSNSGEAVVITDSKNDICAVNSAFERITGYSQDDVLGQNPRILSSGDIPVSLYRNMWASLNARDAWEGELRDKRKDGTIYPKWLSIRILRDIDGRITNHIGIFSDISDRKAAEAQIVHQANHDPLTGLPNRLLMNSFLERTISDARREGSEVCLMILDLDRFKNVNDTLGHHIGDLLLKETATRISSCVRSGDFVARLGGDEFVVILPNVTSSSMISEQVAERIVQLVSRPYELEGTIVRTATSIGLTFYPSDSSDYSGLLKCADITMYHAKSSGRGTWKRFFPGLNKEMIEKQAIENDLKKAIQTDGNQISPWFQPKVSLIDGSICGFEALARWRKDDGTFIPPFVFVPIAEESGLISTLSDIILRKTMDALAVWKYETWFNIENHSVAVNLSPLQFLDKELPEKIKQMLEERSLTSSMIEFEITEGLAMSDPEATKAALNNLRDSGFKVSVDDFGTGYSSLSRLNSLPFSTLKIDRSFVMNIETEQSSREICDVTILLAHRLGMEVVAEGVETVQQMKILLEMGCEKAQGYLFEKPIPFEKVSQFMDSFKMPD